MTEDIHWEPVPLQANEGLAFYGAIPNGTGFFLEPEEAESILRETPNAKDVLLPFLIGKDLNSVAQRASRYAVNFWDWTEERAARYPSVFRIVTKRVKPYRETLMMSKPKLARDWWLYEANPRGLHDALGRGEHFRNGRKGRPLERVLAIARVSSTTAFVFVPPGQVFDCQLIVVASEAWGMFAVLQSAIHLAFAWQHGGKMKSDLRYSPTLCFTPFPFPLADAVASLAQIGSKVHGSREDVLRTRQVGLTELANLVHSGACKDSDIQQFRSELQAMDRAVLAAYEWHDIDLAHDFHRVAYLPPGRNVRFTISETARKEVLRRLAELNRERYKEEAASTSQTTTPRFARGRSKAPPPEQGALALAASPASAATTPAKKSRGRRTNR